MAAAVPLAELFATPLVSLNRSRRDVIEISSTAELSDAFSTLAENSITSAPVKDAETGKYVGFIDVRDLTSFLVHFGAHIDEGNFMVADVCAAGAGSVLDNVTVSYLARRNPFKGVKADATIGDAVKLITTAKVKRVAVVNDDGQAEHIISLSDMILFFATHITAFPESFINATANAMFGKDVENVLCVKATQTVLEALTIMDDHKITGIAIIDDDSGAIVSNISGKDLRKFIKNPTYQQLHMPVVEMIKALRQASQVDIATPAIVVYPTTLVHMIVKKLAATKVHRVYIVESESHFAPIGVVTQTSIIKKVATFLPADDA
ncbi:uncharacterized protein AMSG_03888 [Thecamonas trahens ATCC 50062]|uniref:CBS domain-containing protein n=1 Tax=Thecamonas trahens ATCC 50062 TaxID=461836 RepID=A0A0L0D8P1_THETB|nr:hypothetical protein AMSG_03888 [Thecamonas trahens ATCC 50062]KNC47658.1 hypothetical protein AMSG_03888 [Thecamonas trahens ATCC 50062]|eukprot:XP_013759142.1 hypothetical protein AMSG_03888 [Thecamonas trahens ATCC 50062]